MRSPRATLAATASIVALWSELLRKRARSMSDTAGVPEREIADVDIMRLSQANLAHFRATDSPHKASATRTRKAEPTAKPCGAQRIVRSMPLGVPPFT